MAAQFNAIAATDQESDAIEYPDPITDAQRQYQLEVVHQEIEFYINRGKISDLEMQELQGAIAKLDEEGRRAMLGQLVKALNSGELEGRL